MNEPLFLTPDQVEGFHRRALELFGGLDGLRDRALFESAVAQAQNVYWYGQGDLHAVAATYAFHLAQAQAFLDGNKRTAVAAALTFLKLNGVDTRKDITAPLLAALVSVANHELDRDGLAALLRQWLPLK